MEIYRPDCTQARQECTGHLTGRSGRFSAPLPAAYEDGELKISIACMMQRTSFLDIASSHLSASSLRNYVTEEQDAVRSPSGGKLLNIGRRHKSVTFADLGNETYQWQENSQTESNVETARVP